MAGRRRTAVLISGRGSNLQALIAAARELSYPAEVALAVSNRPDAAGLELAREAGIETLAIDHKHYSDRAEFDTELDRTLKAHAIELVACAGYMRIMTAEFVARWEGALVNIHPSLLPLYRGVRTHERALADGVRIHGCTVHFVTPELDAGPIIAQSAVPVLTGDTAEALAARVLKAEHRLYPMALALVASGKARIVSGRAAVDAAADEAAQLFSPDQHGTRWAL